MSRKLGMLFSLVTLTAVLVFALTLLVGDTILGSLASLIIAMSLLPLVASFAALRKHGTSAGGFTAVGFAAAFLMLAALGTISQLTTLPGLAQNSSFFPLFGCAFAGFAFFYSGFTIDGLSASSRALGGFLFFQGIFALAGLLLPLLGFYAPGMLENAWITPILLGLWCAACLPVCILALQHFQGLSRSSRRPAGS